MSPPTGESPLRESLAAALRAHRMRARLSRSEVAARAGLDPSVLSRLERAEYPHRIKSETLSRLASALDCNDSLHLAAGLPTPTVQELNPALQRAHLAAGDPATRDGLRRLELRGFAARFDRAALGRDGSQVDEMRLALAVGRETGREVVARSASSELDAAGRRFWTAHAAAHALLQSHGCRWPRLEPGEGEANYVAGALLAPDRLVQAAVRSCLIPRSEELWDYSCADLTAEVAERLLVPGWVAIQRIAEAGQIELFLPLPEEELEEGL
ncbi:helix-turn-helix transcriptional regulator [Actinomadura sp. 7K507]|uniref:helix-turn-helix domain-containing protein n=1 Tax=Actinomadura sp. 7K507 TaxID=2530365 RepID=UPI001047BF14|nr:helix-turn-helix transcriptional regulator [Actinomadura sp. 7K507]TDC88831.1 XRE family transcriptional regulator [Actinomadura sp. 7K507]